MHDPFPFSPPSILVQLITPLSDFLNLPTLPLHIHEVLFATLSYHLTCIYISPLLSRLLFPSIYPSLPRRTQLNWDVHVVSLVQSVFVCAAAIWVIIVDEERKAMDWKERVWGYDGGGGMIQAFAAGYFLWDLQICVRYLGIFGWGMLMHAVSALIVFSLGFRPFVNFYAPTFILYELSSPFLNFHWFFDKLHMTGSPAQWYNGIALLGSFFCCRLIWGTYQSLRVYQDCWAALHISNITHPLFSSSTSATTSSSSLLPHNVTSPTGIPALSSYSNDEVVNPLMHYYPAPLTNIPLWLALTYLGSNMCLNTLNFYWFGKMIETVKSRFRTPKTQEKREDGKEDKEEGAVGAVVEGVELDGEAKAEEMDGEDEGEGGDGGVTGDGMDGEIKGEEMDGGVKGEEELLDGGVRKRTARKA
ncbi:MAG: hypothetical protein Q9220_003131 [cf. Caloplaca sp. 1 TL-2023]